MNIIRISPRERYPGKESQLCHILASYQSMGTAPILRRRLGSNPLLKFMITVTVTVTIYFIIFSDRFYQITD
jgi:hypothetical protein